MIEWALPLWGELLVFAATAGAIGLAGTKLARYADQVADRTGLGEALTGTVLLGAITALPGLTASVVAALDGRASLAISNALGGIAIQTVALAGADVAYPKANLEHAAASAPNLVQTLALVLLLTVTLTGFSGPDVTLGHVHPSTLLLVAFAAAAFWLVYLTRERPMWRPRETTLTVRDEPDPEYEKTSMVRLSLGVVGTGLVTALAGAAIEESAENLVVLTGIPEAVVGGLLLAGATSLPELVTSVSAVREGALTLAVSDIVGGNFFDVLFVAAADVAFIGGSLYHAPGVGDREVFLVALTILLNLVLLGGLLHRQEGGPARIGVEGVLMIVLYLGGFLVLSLGM